MNIKINIKLDLTVDEIYFFLQSLRAISNGTAIGLANDDRTGEDIARGVYKKILTSIDKPNINKKEN